MKRVHRVVSAALLLTVLSACVASSPTSKPIEQRALADIKVADTLYFTTLQAAGQLHNAKPPRIDDVAFKRVLDAAEVVRVAREAAATALLTYLGGAQVVTTSEDALREHLETALARLAASVLQLRTEAP